MKVKNSIQIIIIPIIIFIYSCNQKKIEITSEYIINENWSKKNEQAWANSITINKMKVKKDSTLNPFSDLSQEEILSKLEVDSSFIRYTNVKIERGASYTNKKIYFNRDNGFYWGSKLHDSNDDTAKTIGNLQPKSWYKFSHLLTFPFYVYIYIDSSNGSHRFNVNLGNY